MEAAPAEPLEIEGIGILKSHGRDGEAMRAYPFQECVHILIVGAGFVFGAFGGALPAAGHEVPVFQVSRIVAAARGCLARFGQLDQCVRQHDKIPVEGTPGMVAARRGEVRHFDKPYGLGLDGAQDLRQGDAVTVVRRFRIASEIADRLKVNPPDVRGALEAEADDPADIVIVDAGYDRRNERHAEKIFGTGRDGGLFLFQKSLSPDFFVDGILRPVKLEEDEREPGVGQGLREGALLSETQAVGVELNIFAAGLFCRRDDLRQVVPNGRFTA